MEIAIFQLPLIKFTNAIKEMRSKGRKIKNKKY